MASLLLRSRRILEYVRCWRIWFLNHPPISLYYIQGLNTTAVHAHAALFGVYGFLALGFVFLIARYLRPDTPFNDKLMKWGFWLLNGGLVLMIVSSLLPIGIIQGYASISEGLWYARSEEFMQQPLFDTLRWVRFVATLSSSSVHSLSSGKSLR